MTISGPALLAQIGAGGAPVILDVRSAQEFQRGHVPGALHVPFTAVGERLADIPGSPREPVVVYCQYGPRAWIAGRTLRRNGFTRVIYLKGHFHRWQKAGLRVETR